MEPVPGSSIAVLDFNEDDAPGKLHAMIGGKADGVLSDMAANTTGHKKTDQIRIAALVELAADFAVEVLAPGGFFLAKVFQGGTESDLMAILKKSFAQVRHVKPAAAGPIPRILFAGDGFRGAPERPRRCWFRAGRSEDRGWSPL